jgi:enoyl-CoA hydratase
VGKGKAMDLVLTGRMMDAAEAERAGLVSRVVPADKLLAEALAPRNDLQHERPERDDGQGQCVNRAFESGLNDGVGYERHVFHSLFATADQKEGMDAFVNKRKPVFKQR